MLGLFKKKEEQRSIAAILRKTADRISSESYLWKDLGICNCGNLAQVVTGLPGKEITRLAIKKHGDWEMLTKLHQPNSGYEIDHILDSMIEIGFRLDQIAKLENLSDQDILNEIGVDLRRDKREDVVLYLNTWADLIERENKLIKI